MMYKFAKPYEFEGKTFETLQIDIEGMKGSDLSAVKKQWAGAGNFSPMPSLDLDFCINVAQRMSKQPLEFFEQMPANEYSKLAQAVTNFLAG